MESPQKFYASHSPMTAPGLYAKELRQLPDDLAALCGILQGNVIHRDMAPPLYHVPLSEAQVEQRHVRPLQELLKQVMGAGASPLSTAREPKGRFAGICWHFSLMMTAILREKGIPARPRCGFGAYFITGTFEDHWVCEYWNAEKKRWILVDAQLDALQRKLFPVDFDPLDVPRDRFIIAGDAWQKCRRGGADPKKFGLSHAGLSGMWFVAGNVVRDFASLNRMELLPWDVWGAMAMPGADLNDDQKELLDRVAPLSLAGDEKFDEVRKLYDCEERLRVPPVVFNALHNAQESIAT